MVFKLFPISAQRYCLRNIYVNFYVACFRGEELKKNTWMLLANPTHIAMQNMKDECDEAIFL